jgi:hypothetical protein
VNTKLYVCFYLTTLFRLVTQLLTATESVSTCIDFARIPIRHASLIKSVPPTHDLTHTYFPIPSSSLVLLHLRSPPRGPRVNLPPRPWDPTSDAAQGVQPQPPPLSTTNAASPHATGGGAICGPQQEELRPPVSSPPSTSSTRPQPPAVVDRIYHIPAADIAALQSSTGTRHNKLEYFTDHSAPGPSCGLLMARALSLASVPDQAMR